MSRTDDRHGGLELALLGRLWQFSRADGSVIARHLRLIRGGAISGHRQRNESAWQIRDGSLEFVNHEGTVTCRFDQTSIDERGLMTLSGAFLRKRDVIHVLQEVRLISRLGQPNANPRVALLVRTHLANDKLFDLLDLLHQSRRYDLFVLADETAGALDVRGYAKVSHSADLCAGFGLCTQHNRILWHCGDYPLYFAAAELPDYDYYAMIEYDVDLVRKSPLFLEGLIARLHDVAEGGVDFVSAGVVPAFPNWWWAKTASRMFETVYTTGLFAFLLISAKALNHLLSVRRREAQTRVAADDIVHCEAFCASALMDAGFSCVSINTLIDNAVEYASFHPSSSELPNSEFLLNQYRLENPRVEMVHPVYDLEGYLDKNLQRSMRNNDWAGFINVIAKIDGKRPADAELLSKYRNLALLNAKHP